MIRRVLAFNSSIWVLLSLCELYWVLLVMVDVAFGFERLVWGHLWGLRDGMLDKRGFL